ncbi:zinc-binding dehydrogenase [Rhodococcus wratislaviensis]|nr:zinc-binding dehydrogenase [Rhodococcus wratislaviensis]
MVKPIGTALVDNNRMEFCDMWAQQLVRPGVFELIDTSAPDPEALHPGDALLKVHAGAICGSDLPYFAGRRSPLFDDDIALAANVPGFPLHEVVGEVIASADPRLPVGARAVGWATRTTAMAEYTVSKADNLWAIPDDRPASEALTLQPLACVTETVRGLGDLSGKRVAVLGLGPFGVLFSHVAKSFGAHSVVGVDRIDRSDVAHHFQIDELVHSSSDRWSQTIRDEQRPDIIIEAVGHQTATLGDAIEALAVGGRVFYFGVPDEPMYPFPMQKLFRKKLTMAGGVIGDRRNALQRADDYLKLYPELHKTYVTHTFPMRSAQAAFETASTPAKGRLKVQLTVED